MTEIVEKALFSWGLNGAEFQLIAARENAVYRVSTDDGYLALRVHRKEYRTDAELNSELVWMAEASRCGISVPTPIANSFGNYLHHIDDAQIDILTWLAGKPLSKVIANLGEDERSRLFFNLGREMAKLHATSDAWSTPEGFDRVHWNVDGLLGENPLWDRFWENPELTREQRVLLVEFRHAALNVLNTLDGGLDYGLIHADLVPDNILVDDHQLRLIDFDDGGFGYRLFDIATSLLKHRSLEDYQTIKGALINGYHATRDLDVSMLDLLIAIRSVTYVGWNIIRLNEEHGIERNKRFIDTSLELIRDYLEAKRV